MSLIDPSRITPRDWLIIGLALVIGFAAWHEFIVQPGRMIKQLCERVDVLEPDKISEDVRSALDEMVKICRDRKPIEE